MISILVPSGILLAIYWARYFADRYKHGKRVPLLVPLAFTCLFIPKINLMEVNRTYSTAGIRTDDLMIIIMLIISLREAYTYRNRYIRWGIGFLAAITGAGLVSMMTGITNGYENEVLFSILSILRKFEYFAFALIGICIARKTECAEKAILKEFTWMSCFHILVGLLQVTRVCGYAVSGIVMSKPSFWDAGIAISTFNGHYEYGQFLCFGIAVYLCAFLRTMKLRYAGLFVLTCFMTWLTDSRSSLVVGLIMTVLVLLFSVRKSNRPYVNILVFTGIALFAAASILFMTGTLKIGRFSVVNLGKYAENLAGNIAKGDLRQYAEMIREGVKENSVMDRISDGSASVRFFKWGAALDGFRQFPFFGYGTGVTHVIDGNYVKLLGENGLAGLLLWLGMYGFFMKAVWTAVKKVTYARSVLWMMVSVLIGAAFIDMFEASKPMEMLWLGIGLVLGPVSTGEDAECRPVRIRVPWGKVIPAAACAAALLLLYALNSFKRVPILQVSGVILLVYWAWYIIRRRKEIPLTIPLLFTCLFLPKLNLLKVTGMSTAGIRIDDFLALGLLITAVVKDSGTWKNRYIKRGIQLLILLSAVNLLSVAAGRIQGYENQVLLSVLMVIRKFEYFAFALIGIYAVRKLKDPYRVFMNEFTLMSILHILLSVLQLLSKTTYMVSGEDALNFFRGIAVSTFNGYYEYGQFLCFGCAVFLCDYLKNRNRVSLVMVPLTLAMLVLSKSRSSLVVGLLLVVLAVYFPIRGKVSGRRLLIGGLGMLGVLAAVILFTAGILKWNAIGRFGTVKPDEFAANLGIFIRKGNFPQYVSLLREGVPELDAIEILGYVDNVTDWSAALRFLKWFAATDGFRLNPVLGYGTGVTHVMDGNYIKLLAETGIAGTALWLGFYGFFMRAVNKLRRHTKIGRALLLIMVSILLNSLLIDMFEASKPMELLWLMVGGALAYGAAAGPANSDEPAPEQEGTGESFPAAGQEQIHPEGITE